MSSSGPQPSSVSVPTSSAGSDSSGIVIASMRLSTSAGSTCGSSSWAGGGAGARFAADFFAAVFFAPFLPPFFAPFFAAGLRALAAFAPPRAAFFATFFAGFFALDFDAFFAAFLVFVAFFALGMAKTLLEVGPRRGEPCIAERPKRGPSGYALLRRSALTTAAAGVVDVAAVSRPTLARQLGAICPELHGSGYAAFSSDSSAPSLRQSHSMQRRVVPRFVSFLSTNLAWHTGHGCGMGLSHATKSQPFFAQFEQP